MTKNGKRKSSHAALDPNKAYLVARGTVDALTVGTSGFTLTHNIDEEDGLYTLGVLQSIGATLALIALIHEAVEAVLDRKNFSTGRSLYLFFCLSFIVINYIAAALLINSAATEDIDGPKATVGMCLAAVGLFVSNALHAKNRKSSTVEPGEIVELENIKKNRASVSDDSDHESDLEEGNVSNRKKAK